MTQPILHFLKRVVLKLDKFSPWPLSCPFIMTPQEKEFFNERVRESKMYLEFGMGGSTFHVLKNSKAKVFSIDSSMDWIRFMRKYWFVKFMERKRLSLFYVNIGITGSWGHPINLEHQHLFPDYSTSIFDKIEKSTIDTVLIDGRFRVACMLQTILNCNENSPIQILVHDFWNRPEYHVALKYIDEIGRAESLGAFQIKKGIDLIAVQKEFETYKYNPA